MKLLKKPSTWILVLILIVAAGLRFYQVKDYAVFLGDEGRDVIVVRNILMGNLTLLGPTASVGGFYLGPIYYYMMAPFLYAWNFDPVGPAYLVSLLGTATVYLVYVFGKRFFHPVAGLSAAFLYALAPLILRYSRASWNPNPLPFFMLLGVFLLAEGIRRKKKLLLFLSGACLGVAWQLHYLALIATGIYLTIISGFFKRTQWLKISFDKKTWRKISVRIGWVTLGWATTFSPFLAFEIRHGFPNTRTVVEFITRPSGSIDLKPLDIISTTYVRATRLFFEAFSMPESIAIIIFSIITIIALIHASRKRNKALLLWFFVGILGMSIYQGDIHDYYFGFLFPVPFLMTGVLIYLLWIKGKLGKVVSLGLLATFAVVFISQAFFQRQANRVIKQTKDVSVEVLKLADGQPYNFGLISAGNSDHAYRYFLLTSNNPPKTLEEEVTSQLIIVCEQPKETCEPRGHPLWQIAGFGRKEIDQVVDFEVASLTLFKTVHHQSSLDMIGKPVQK